MRCSTPEVADYAYVILFKVILIIAMWFCPFLIYEELNKRPDTPKLRKVESPFQSITRRSRRYSTNRRNRVRGTDWRQVKGMYTRTGSRESQFNA